MTVNRKCRLLSHRSDKYQSLLQKERQRNEELHLQRVYKFPDFKTALAFTNLVREVVEKQGHHPVLVTEWGKVTVTWWTHAINGLHRNDFVI